MSLTEVKQLYTSEKNALNCLLDRVAALLRDQNVGAKKLEEAMRGLKVSLDVFSNTYEELFVRNLFPDDWTL